MAGLQNRKSVLGIMEEVSEGTPVFPAASTDYLPLQDGFDMSPSFDALDSKELQSSIGKAKGVIGAENPEFSDSHYIRHSGVEGQKPNFSKVLKAAFGAESVNATEYDTVAASTTLVVKVDAGEGANFERGEALLLKDGANGYSIRNVLSVSGDDLTLGQALSAAPAASVNLGKAILYKPADSGHSSLTGILYRANGGATEMISGARVSELTIKAVANDFVNCDYKLQGISYYLDPMNITATDTKLDFSDGSPKVATITAKVYKDPTDLASAIQTAMNSVSSGITVAYSSSTGKYTISKASGTLSLLWFTGANAANTVGDKIGFDTSADDTGSLSYLADNALSFAAPHTPSYDNSQPLVAKYNEVMLGDIADISCFGAQEVTAKLSDTKVDIPDLCAESGRAGSIVSSREVSIDVVALLKQYDADKFARFRQGTQTSFTYNFGEKSGGNWVAGKSANIYCPTATISSFKVDDKDGLAVLNMTLTAYVESGKGEFYLNFL